MKNSHRITPRTLGDCEFIASDDPIERPEIDHWDAIVAWICVAALAFVAALIWLENAQAHTLP